MTRCAAGQHGTIGNIRPWPDLFTDAGVQVFVGECSTCHSTLAVAEPAVTPSAYSCYFCGTINDGLRQQCWRCERRGGPLAVSVMPQLVAATAEVGSNAVRSDCRGRAVPVAS